ncbi:Uncharacterised protein [Bordetella pertussis]|nr:Uncharacterised protein [Bordetella pertussis]CFP60891.1 Uncharacterised protein [Bordetella pertussis]CFW28723.1 Uncharacterised protein [Bordetella pertussis]
MQAWLRSHRNRWCGVLISGAFGWEMAAHPMGRFLCVC